MGEILNLSYTNQIQLFYHEWNYIRTLLMIQAQILLGCYDRRYLESPEATNRSVPITHDWKKDKAVVSLCLSYCDASTDLQHSLLGSKCNLTGLWSQLKCWPNRSKSSCISCDELWREEHDEARNISPAFLVQKLFAKNFKIGYFVLCLHLASKASRNWSRQKLSHFCLPVFKNSARRMWMHSL